MQDYGPLDMTRFHTSFITDALWNIQYMTVAFPAIVRKQSRLMTPPPRSHPPIAKRRWTRKGEGGNDVISCIVFIIYTVACYELCCVCVCVFSCRRQKSTESAGSDEEDVDELTLIDHKEIMSRITLKQEVSWCSWVFFKNVL